MRIEYINPFVEASLGVLKNLVGENVKRGELDLRPSSALIQGVAVHVDLTGGVKGRVLFDMNLETALHIVSAMNGEAFSEMDEMAKATIQELANIITAQAVSKLYKLGFQFDLSPPRVFTGDNVQIASSVDGREALVVPMEIEGQYKLDVSVVINAS